MKVIAIRPKTARKGIAEAFRQLIFLFIVAMALYASNSYPANTAACADCGIYESRCQGKAVQWTIRDDDGWAIKGKPQNLLRSDQAREFIQNVKKKHPGKFHSREICGDNELA